MSDRTKQVQFRMPDELHTELKAALAYDRSSFADFFNKAAEDYLSNHKQTHKKSKSKNGGNKTANTKVIVIPDGKGLRLYRREI